MRKKSILVIDDDIRVAGVLQDLLTEAGYAVTTWTSPIDAISDIERELPCVVISDVNMPQMDGYELCRRIRGRFTDKIIPIILVTGADAYERTEGLLAGADEFLSKPVDATELLARVRSLVRIRDLHDTVAAQAEKLRVWGDELESRVTTQVEQLNQLRAFFSPQVAKIVSCVGGPSLIKIHQRDVTIVFVDIRGFTAFTETARPEDVLAVLSDYYSVVGNHGLSFGGTIGRFMGDGAMIYFNDPEDIPHHQQVATRAALAIRDSLADLRKKWTLLGFELNAGIGIACGKETIGLMGFDKYVDYSIIGPATNLASRLCDEAKGDDILVSDYFYHVFLKREFDARQVGIIHFKGIHRAVTVHSISGLSRLREGK